MDAGSLQLSSGWLLTVTTDAAKFGLRQIFEQSFEVVFEFAATEVFRFHEVEAPDVCGSLSAGFSFFPSVFFSYKVLLISHLPLPTVYSQFRGQVSRC